MAERKASKSAVAKRERRTTKKAPVGKPARAGGPVVSFGLHGITRIMKRIHEAGLESELDKHLQHDEKFIKVQRKSLAAIKEFIATKPELADLARETQHCDCPSDDPGCVYI